MNMTLAFVSSQSASTAFQDLDEVRSRCALETREGTVLPPGTVGTVVAVWGGGAAYDVEFGGTPNDLLTVRVEDLELVERRRG